jgi:hypothetical protein
MLGSDHYAPHDGCTCGIYATKSPELTDWCPGVYGEVYLWGTVVEHDFGWRAQYAYPKRFVLSPLVSSLMSPVLGTRMTRNPERWLAPLAAYGADIYLAGEKRDIPLWTARSGYGTDGIERLREVIPNNLPRERLRNIALLKLAIRHLVRKVTAHREKPPGPPPPPPAVPVYSPADIIRIIQSRRDGWPAHWTLAADCEMRASCDG